MTRAADSMTAQRKVGLQRNVNTAGFASDSARANEGLKLIRICWVLGRSQTIINPKTNKARALRSGKPESAAVEL